MCTFAELESVLKEEQDMTKRKFVTLKYPVYLSE